MILKDIYFFEETNQIGDSKILINENKGDMLSLQVNCEGNFNFEVQGCIDIVSDTYNKVFATNMLTSERQENVTSNGIYQIDIDGYRRIKLVLNSIGSQPITVYGVMKEENGDIDIEDDIATKDYVNAAISGKEDASNKVTSIDNNSTDVQYPSAKCVYDNLITKQDVFQFSTMPEATVSTLGIIVQYTGTTDNNYTNGYFYKGISSTVANETVYLWENINVQASSSIVSIDYSSIYSLTESSTSEQIIAAFGGADKVDEIINAAKEGKLFLGTSEVPGTITTGIDTSMLVQVFYKEHDWSGEDTLTLYFIPSITSQYNYGESLTKLNSLKIKKCRFDRDRDNGEMYCLEAREIGFIDSLYMISTEVDELTTSSTSVEINAIINLPNIIEQETGAWGTQANHKAYTFNVGELQNNYYFIGLCIQNLNPPFFNGDIRVKLSYIAPTNKLTTLVLNYNENTGSSVISKDVIELDNLENSSNKATSISSSSTDVQYPSAKCVYDNLITKQDTLISGTNIKTINNQSILGSGNITISGGSSSPYIYTGTNTADDIEAFESIIDEYNQTGKWDLDYIIYKNTTVMRDVQIRMNEATLLSSTSYVKSYRFIFKGDYQAANTQYNTTLYGKATVVWLNGDYSINFEVETVDNIAPLDNNLQYDRKVLTTDNTTSFTPTNDYHPATKKYVDDIVGDINTVLSSLVNVGGGN